MTEMEQYSIKHLQDELSAELEEDYTRLKDAVTQTTAQALPLLTRESMLPYKYMRNLVELPIGSTHTVTITDYIEHYGQEKLVVKLEDGVIYQAGDDLEEHKE